MDPAMEALVREGYIIPLVAIVFGCLTGIVAIVACAIRGAVVVRTQEQTKRELAAYVAEGTIDADKAIAMLNTGNSKAHADDLA